MTKDSFFKNYGLTLMIIAGVLIGGACGVAFGEAAHAVKPIGDLFLNLIFVMIVPLVFFSISSAVCRMRGSGNLGRLLVTVLGVFLAMSFIAAVFAYLATLFYDPLGDVDRSRILGNIAGSSEESSGNIADIIVGSLTVPDFSMLLSKSHLLPMIVFAALFGFATNSCGDKGKVMAGWLESGSEVMMKMMGLIMYLAPIGLGCYFADTVATVGSQLLEGYLRTFILFIALTAVTFFGLNSLYVFLARGKEGLKAFWRHIITPALTAIATSSSAATIPSAIIAAKRMGVSTEIAETVIPFGTNVHKDGSVMLNAFKVVFVMLLASQNITSPGAAISIISIGIVSAIVMGAVPVGGFTGEILICSLLGLNPEMAGVLVVIATIADMPATLLNSTSNIVGAVLVDSVWNRKTVTRS